MTRPSDVHYDRIDEQAFELARRVLDAIQSLEAEAILGGGWAVYAHTAHVPSVDVDLYLSAEAREPVEEHLERSDLTVGPHREVEMLALDSGIDLWISGDPDLGIARPSYTPAEVFDGRLEERTLELPQGVVPTTVPDRPSLAFTKLVALANRDLAHRAREDGQARMQLGPSLANRVLGRSRSYYRRKAGKDLFDLAVLLGDGEGQRFVEIVKDQALWSEAVQVPGNLASETVRLARDFADRESTVDPLETVEHWLEA